MATSDPPCPRRAKTRSFPSFVLGSTICSTYAGDRAGLGRLRVGRVLYRYASGFFSPAALLGKGRILARLGKVGVIDGHFEHPKTLFIPVPS